MLNIDRKKYYITLIKESKSLREVCLKANISVTTGNYDTLKKIIKEENINISHFKRSNVIANYGRRATNEYLSNKYYISAFRLKKRLIDEGYKEYKCECCGNTEWMGKPIPLELHHIDGNKNNNSLTNLKIICPNCHCFTDNYSGKNQKMNIKKHYCKHCGKVIGEERKKSLYCSDKCQTEHVYKKEIGYISKDMIINAINTSNSIKEASNKIERHPSTFRHIAKKFNIDFSKLINKKKYNIEEIIKRLKETHNFRQVGKEVGVSDNAIRKRLKCHGYSVKIDDL